MVLVFRLARRENSGDIGGLFVIHPHSAHGVVHAGENLHGRDARIVADKLLVNFEDAFQLAVKNLGVDVGEVEINHRLSVDAEFELEHDFENGARCHIARHEIPILRIPFFEEIPALFLGNGFGIALVSRSFWNPDTAPFAARRFRHQA